MAMCSKHVVSALTSQLFTSPCAMDWHDDIPEGRQSNLSCTLLESMMLLSAKNSKLAATSTMLLDLTFVDARMSFIWCGQPSMILLIKMMPTGVGFSFILFIW